MCCCSVNMHIPFLMHLNFESKWTLIYLYIYLSTEKPEHGADKTRILSFSMFVVTTVSSQVHPQLSSDKQMYIYIYNEKRSKMYDML